MPAARITGIGTAAPAMVKMTELGDFFATGEPEAEMIRRTFTKSGIATKGMAVDPLLEDPRDWDAAQRMSRGLDEALRLGERAVDEALARAGLRPDEIGLFATMTTTVHGVPGLASLAHRLGVRADAELLSFGPMGCYAAVPSLAMCRAWVEVNRKPAVLVGVDVYSPHLPQAPYDKEQAVVTALFGDGAAAVVFRPVEPGVTGLDFLDTEMRTDHRYVDDLRVSLDDRIRVQLSQHMSDIVSSAISEPTDLLLARNGLRREDIRWWAVHTGGPRIIDQVAEVLDLPAESVETSRGVLRDYGNVAGPAVLFVVERLQEASPLAAGEHGVILAFGPGATIWTALVRGA